MNKCSNCGNEFEGKFCPKCGTEFVASAPSFCKMCGTQLKEGAKFCHKCGYNAATGEKPAATQQPTPAPPQPTPMQQPVPQPTPAPQPNTAPTPQPSPQAKELNRFQMAFKAAKFYVIASIIGFAAGIAMLIAFIASGQAGLLIGVAVFVIAGIALAIGAASRAKQMMRAICPECKKLMGQSTEAVSYEYECTQYKENYKSSGEFIDYSFIYTCSIECPHCGSTSTFEHKLNAKTKSQADSKVNNYLKETLKMK